MAQVDSGMVIRDAIGADLPTIRDLYNGLIATTAVAWTEEPQTLAERQAWFAEQTANDHPVLVAVEGSHVIGFTAYGSFRGSGKWPGYRQTVEHTIHIAEEHWGRGIGRMLLERLIERARAADIHVMVGAVDGENDASIRFHERLGFVESARMPEVGRKFDRWLDLVLMQRKL